MSQAIHRNNMLTKGILALLALLIAPHAAWSQSPTGSISGTVTNADKKPVNNATSLVAGGIYLDLQEYRTEMVYNPNDNNLGVWGNRNTDNFHRSTDNNAGGLYNFDKLRPGVYNLIVEAGALGDTHYRPQRIVGIIVKPGQETTLDITLHEGDALEDIGSPKGNAAEGKQTGWLEGVVTSPDGIPVQATNTLIAAGVGLTVKKSTGEQGRLGTDRLAGGFFSAILQPGVYDLIVDTGETVKTDTTYYRPQIIRHVPVKAGVRTFIHVTMHEGQALERITAPTVTTQPIQVADH